MSDIETLKDRLHDLVSHRSAWRQALEHTAETVSDDTGYWRHELRRFDEAFAALDTYMAANPVQEPSPESSPSHPTVPMYVAAMRHGPGYQPQILVFVAQDQDECMKRLTDTLVGMSIDLGVPMPDDSLEGLVSGLRREGAEFSIVTRPVLAHIDIIGNGPFRGIHAGVCVTRRFDDPSGPFDKPSDPHVRIISIGTDQAHAKMAAMTAAGQMAGTVRAYCVDALVQTGDMNFLNLKATRQAAPGHSLDR